MSSRPSRRSSLYLQNTKVTLVAQAAEKYSNFTGYIPPPWKPLEVRFSHLATQDDRMLFGKGEPYPEPTHAWYKNTDLVGCSEHPTVYLYRYEPLPDYKQYQSIPSYQEASYLEQMDSDNRQRETGQLRCPVESCLNVLSPQDFRITKEGPLCDPYFNADPALIGDPAPAHIFCVHDDGSIYHVKEYNKHTSSLSKKEVHVEYYCDCCKRTAVLLEKGSWREKSHDKLHLSRPGLSYGRQHKLCSKCTKYRWNTSKASEAETEV